MSRDDKAASSTVLVGRNKETRTVDSRREQSSRLAHALLDCLGLLYFEVASHSLGHMVVEEYLLLNLDDSGVRRLGLNVLLNVLFFGEVIFT